MREHRQGHYDNCPQSENCWCQIRRFSYVLCAAGIIVGTQIAIGVYFGILSLIADGGHTATHSAAYFVALAAAILVRFGSPASETDTRAFYIIVTILFVTTFWIFFESLDRLLFNQKEITGWIMASGALIGFVGNQIEYGILKNMPEEHRDHTHAGITFHVIADRAMSAAVCAGGIINHFTGWTFVDPVVSLVIGCWMFVGTIALIRRKKHNGNDKAAL